MVSSHPGRWAGAERWAALVGLILLPILVKLPVLAGLLRADPMLLYSGLQTGVQPGPIGGAMPTADPNIGFTSQALGHRAALEILGGRMPWWNPFEAVGTPLAGEMQSAALFPPTLLLALPGGQVAEHVLLQIIAGLATYALLRRLALRRGAAFVGGAVFAFNGVFAWLGNAVVNPVAFLPLLLFGIEATADRARLGRAGSGFWIVVALAGSLYAGFPEVAYLDGLLAGVWTLTRAAALPTASRLGFLWAVARGGATGLLLAAPILVAFADYLPLAELGSHAEDGFAGLHLDPAYLSLVALPYLLRGIASAPGHTEFWGNVGGYAGCVLLALAAAGVVGRRQRALRPVLAGWVLLSLAITFGVPGTEFLARIVPGLARIALYRYLPASWIMALCVLGAMALDDLWSGARAWPLWTGMLLLLTFLVLSLARDPPPMLTVSDHVSRGSVAVAGVCLLLLLGLTVWRGVPPARRAAAIGGLLLAEALFLFVVPVLSTPRGGALELGGVAFLRDHLGMQRLATLGPIAPNYGSYFGIASINHNDLPVPLAVTAYIHRHLDANAVPDIFNGIARADPHGRTPVEALLTNRAAYAAVGVRYVVTPPGRRGVRLPGLREVYSDRVLRIWELDDAAPYFAAQGCRLEVRNRTSLSASCDAATPLVRLEMAMPGWRAAVGGTAAPIVTTGEIFQAVALPPGRSEVAFSFEPPFMPAAYGAFAAGLLLLSVGVWRDRAAQKPQATERSLPRSRLR